MKKRGISPLVGTILIIGFTIVIASMVMIWGGDIFQKYKSQTETESMIKLGCVTKINLNIKEACILGDTIKFKLENMGDKEISGFVVRVIGDWKTNVSNLEKSLSAFGVNKFEKDIDVNPVVGIGIPRSLEIFPRIIYEGKEGTCDKTSINLKPCYKLPSLLSFDDWIEIDENNIGASGLVPEGYGNGIGIILNESGNVEIKSNSFIIPNVVKNIKIGGKTNNKNSIYSLKYSNGTNALVLSEGINSDDIQPTREIPNELKGKEVYFSLIINSGNKNDYAILSDLCYTDGIYCKI